MIIPQKYLAVNWADGMKVNKDHFVSTENFVVDNLRDVAYIHVNQLNFGLLPPLSGSGALLSDYEVIKTATNQLQIRINHCQAITTGGVRISIMGDGIVENVDVAGLDENEMIDETNNNADNAQKLYVVIVVDPFKRSLHGHPDPEEIPIRHP